MSAQEDGHVAVSDQKPARRHASIRKLRRDEPIPEGTPKRYDRNGYVILRWRIAPREYVEELEHRVVMGRPDGHVHHINHIRDDNRPENLVALTPKEHAELHASENRGPDEFWNHVASEYQAGMSTVQLSRKYGKAHSYFRKHLLQLGVEMRSTRPPTSGIDEDLAAEALRQPGARATRVARQFGVTKIVMMRIQKERGITPAPTGRPPVSAPGGY